MTETLTLQSLIQRWRAQQNMDDEFPVVTGPASDHFMVGDKICLHRGPGVPKELEGKHWRVEAIEGGAVKLSQPYNDAACTERYYSEAAQKISPEYRRFVKRRRMHENR